LMVKMIDPKIGSEKKEFVRILDPFCGSCGFLVESYKHIVENEKITAKNYLDLQRKMIHGYEKKSLPFLVGLMNCILHGLLTPNILRKNSLNDNILNFGVDDKFDYVLTNPPFGGTENKQIQQNFPIKVQATELLAMQQVMRRLKPGGQCGIVIPEGILFRIDAFARVKEELIKNYNVHTIISLPSGIFANVTSAGQGPKTNLMFFDKKGTTKNIWYYELSSPNGKSYTKANPITDKDLMECYEKWKNKIISLNSWIVNVEEIISKNYDMTAKNPNKEETHKHKSPEQLIESITEKEKHIQELLKELKDSLMLKK